MNFIIRAREELGMTQRELARKLKVSQTSIYRYEQNGKMPLKKAIKLLKMFKGKYTFDDLYGKFINLGGR